MLKLTCHFLTFMIYIAPLLPDVDSFIREQAIRWLSVGGAPPPPLPTWTTKCVIACYIIEIVPYYLDVSRRNASQCKKNAVDCGRA